MSTKYDGYENLQEISSILYLEMEWIPCIIWISAVSYVFHLFLSDVPVQSLLQHLAEPRTGEEVADKIVLAWH